MFPKALTLFRFPSTLDFSELEELAAEAKLRPVGSMELSSSGLVSPFGRDSEVLVHRLGTAIVMMIGTETRDLPGSVVNDALAQKIREIEEREGRRPGGRARKRIKDDLIAELLPRAFVRRRQTLLILYPDLGVLAVDSASRKVAEGAVSHVRALLGSFPALHLNAEINPRSILTGWLAGEPLPDLVRLGEGAELRDPIQGGAVVRLRHQELGAREVLEHLEAGKQCTALGLNVADHLELEISDGLVVRKLKFLDGALDKLGDLEPDSVAAEIDARLALATGEIRALASLLIGAFKVSGASA